LIIQVTMERSESASAVASEPEDLSPSEQDVLDEYERLAGNMKKVLSSIQSSLPLAIDSIIQTPYADIWKP